MKCGGYHGNLHTVIHQTNPVTLFQFKLPVENTGSGTQNKPLALVRDYSRPSTGLGSHPVMSDHPPQHRALHSGSSWLLYTSALPVKNVCVHGEQHRANLLPLRDVTEYNTELLLLPLPPLCMASCSVVMYSSSWEPAYCTAVSRTQHCSLHQPPGMGRSTVGALCLPGCPECPALPKPCFVWRPGVNSYENPCTNRCVSSLTGVGLIFFVASHRVPCFGFVSKTVRHQSVLYSFSISQIRKDQGKPGKLEKGQTG